MELSFLTERCVLCSTFHVKRVKVHCRICDEGQRGRFGYVEAFDLRGFADLQEGARRFGVSLVAFELSFVERNENLVFIGAGSAAAESLETNRYGAEGILLV